jgi:hypothetical protein
MWELKGIKRELQEDIPCLFTKQMSNIRRGMLRDWKMRKKLLNTNGWM